MPLTTSDRSLKSTSRPRVSPGRVIGVGLLAMLSGTSHAVSAAPKCAARRDVDARYGQIAISLTRGRPAARFWWIGWTSGYAAATVAQGALAVATTDRGTRIDSI